MIGGSISITSRPIKLAFLVDYNDKAKLKAAIQINSFIWGGAYNPIIPVYKRMPQLFKDEPIKPSIGGLEITKGYIEAFDADYYINYSSATAQELGLKNDRIVSDTLVMAGAAKNGFVNYAIGLKEVLNHLCEKEFKYIRRQDPLIYNIQFSSRYELFLGGLFGVLDTDIQKKIEKGYAKTLGMKKVTASLSNYTDFLRRDALFLRRFSQINLSTINNGHFDQDCLFFMDATDWQDIVDYINLRAIGRNVVPIPKQSAAEQGIKDFAKEFIEQYFQPLPNNPNGVYTHVNIIKSRGCTFEEVEAFASSLNVTPIEKNQPRISVQRWYPRMWDRWARTRDSVECCTIEYKRKRQQVSKAEVEVDCLVPEFADLYHVSGYPKYANDVSFNMYMSEDYYAEVLPSSIPNAAHLLRTIDFNQWRFSRNGATYTSYAKDKTIHLTVPSAENIFDAWADSQGLKIKLSNPGKIARKIVHKLGGPERTGFIANKLLLERIQQQTNGPDAPRPITYRELVGLFNLMKNRQKLVVGKADSFIYSLIKSSVIELGVEVRCPNCSKTTWYKLSGLSRTLSCPVCLDEFEAHDEEPDKTFIWSYALQGPFRLPKMADGSYTVVLALNFFTDLYKSTVTPQYSFESTDGTFEADFGVLLKQNFESDSDVLPIFGECKSFSGQFEPHDINKMMKLGDKVKNSVLVFATLREELGKTEKKLLLQKVQKMRELRFKGKSYNQILILTANELFGRWSLSQTWKDLGGKYAKYERVGYSHNIDWLCNATQELYLDIEPFDEVLKKRFSSSSTVTISPLQSQSQSNPPITLE
jgi:hypothetical protein